MLKKLSLGLVALGIVGVLLFLVFTNSNTPQTEIANSETTKITAKLEIFEGTVSTKTGDSEYTTATNGQEVVVGTQIKTADGARAQIVYSNDSVTRIDENAEVVVENLDKSGKFSPSILIKTGRVWSRIAKLIGGEGYETKTSTTVATIRGTSYGHGILANGENKVTTTKGEVQGRCVNGSQEETVGVDTKSFYNCKVGTDARVGDIDNSDQDDWFEFNEEEDKKLNEKFGEETYDDEEDVLGLATSSPTPTPVATARPVVAAATPNNLIDCVGPDGITTKQTKETCDFVNKFWQENGPKYESPSSPSSSNNSSTPEPTPTPTETPLPVPILTSAALEFVDTCGDGCFNPVVFLTGHNLQNIVAAKVNSGTDFTAVFEIDEANAETASFQFSDINLEHEYQVQVSEDGAVFSNVVNIDFDFGGTAQ